MSGCDGACTCTCGKETVRDDDYIDGYLKILGMVWKKYPDLRFGQFILNSFEEEVLYNIEDPTLMKDLDKKYEKW